MTSGRTRVNVGAQWLRRRLFWTAVLLLICLGGAGLVAAVDRPVTQAARPEVSWSADRRAVPWLEAVLGSLRAIDTEVGALSGAGRRVLVEANSLDVAQLEVSLDAGDEIVEQLVETLRAAVALRESPPEGVEPWRLGDENLALLARIDEALVSAGRLPAVWQELARQARLAGDLLGALQAHDEAALAGLVAGSEGRWEDAVTELQAALAEHEAALGLRASLPADAGTDALDDLLADLRRHDEALLALYRHLAADGSVDDEDGSALRQAAEQARLPVPTQPQRLQAVISQVAGAALSEGLSAIEDVRANILDALDDGEEDVDLDDLPADEQLTPEPEDG